jgi:hypothetical protein
LFYKGCFISETTLSKAGEVNSKNNWRKVKILWTRWRKTKIRSISKTKSINTTSNTYNTTRTSRTAGNTREETKWDCNFTW